MLLLLLSILPSLLFPIKVRSQVPALVGNIRLGRKCLPGTNTLGCLSGASVMKRKPFYTIDSRKLRNYFDKTINDQEEDKDNPPKVE
jgi:hypothetical protein